MSKGREFQIVGAATEKLLEPKHVRTRGTENRLVSDERVSACMGDRLWVGKPFSLCHLSQLSLLS